MKKRDFLTKVNNRFDSIRIIIDAGLVALNIIATICTFLGAFSYYIHPETFILPSYLGLAFPYLLLGELLFLFFWIIRKKIFFLIPLFTFILCCGDVRRTISIGHNKKAEGDTLSITSYNCQMFQFFATVEKNEALAYVANCGSDIVCVQEFGYSDTRWHLTHDDIKATLSPTYKYFHFNVNNLTWNAQSGEAILSKYPIIRKGVIDYESELNGAIYADILYKGDTIRVFSCHLESNKLTDEEKETLKKMKRADVSKKDANMVMNSVSTKMSTSYKLRAQQAEKVGNLVKNTHYPIILCGDFNDVPVSYAYHQMKAGKLIDSFEECGFGYGYTYNMKMFHFRIDQIMHSEDCKAVDFEIGKEKYSDHYPISCKIVF